YGTGTMPPGELQQYIDVAEWENQIFEGANLSAGKEYWPEYLNKCAGYAALTFESSDSNEKADGLSKIHTFAVREQSLCDWLVGMSYDPYMERATVAWLWLIQRHRTDEGDLLEIASDVRTDELSPDAIRPLTRVIPLRTALRR